MPKRRTGRCRCLRSALTRRPPGSSARSGAGGERVLHELGVLLERLTAERPLIVLIEDLHGSDYATLDAIRFLARQTAPARVLILGTWRPSDVKAARHPVYALTQELRVRRQCAVISLPELDGRSRTCSSLLPVQSSAWFSGIV